ncbi:radical SAM protein [bacterium]|nr:radical SAM protein [bacterium]
MVNKPFIKKIRINDKYYIYDVNTNEILKVDKLNYTFVDNIEDDITYKISKIYNSPKNINKVKEEINLFTKKGYFSTHRPKINYFRTEPFKKRIKESMLSNISKITLVVTEDCNLRCKYCIYSDSYKYHRIHSEKYMSLTVMKKAVDFYLKYSSKVQEKTISFYGGEPLLNFKLIAACVKYIKEKHKGAIRLLMTTNATLLNKDIIKYLVENNFSLLISLDGPERIHDRYRVFKNSKGTFNTIMRNLKIMESMYPDYYKKKVRFNMVLAPPYHFSELNQFIINEEIIAKAVRVKCAMVNKKNTVFFKQFSPAEREKHIESFVNILNNFKRKLSKNEKPSKLEMSLFRMKYLNYHRRVCTTLSTEVPSHGQCTFPERGIFINSDGTFNFCSYIEDVYNLGSVFNGFDFNKIYNFYTDLEDLYSKYCFNCWAVRFCQKCVKDFNRNGIIDEELFRKKCNNIREGIYNDLVSYITIREQNYNAFDFLNDIEIV